MNIIIQNAPRATSGPVRRSIASHARASSTSASASTSDKDPSSSRQVYLNEERKRMLVSLYHQSERFVTHENLSALIDFEVRRGFRHVAPHDETARSQLKTELAQRRTRPKTVALSAAHAEDTKFTRIPSHALLVAKKNTQIKSRRLKAAVYGLDDSYKASLEMVEEHRRTYPIHSDE